MKQTISTYPNKELFKCTRDIPKDQIKAETFSQIGSAMLEILRKQVFKNNLMGPFFIKHWKGEKICQVLRKRFQTNQKFGVSSII